MRYHVQHGVDLALHFGMLVEADGALELVVPVSLSLVCFRWKGRGEEDQQRLLDAVKATGECFIIHTKLEGKIVLRLGDRAGGVRRRGSVPLYLGGAEEARVNRRCSNAWNNLKLK